MTPHFTREEMACPHCGKMEFTQRGVERLEPMREDYGRPIIVASGHRCPVYDAMVHKRRHPRYIAAERHGPHTLVAEDNVTIDTPVYGYLARLLVYHCLKYHCFHRLNNPLLRLYWLS